jgi:hypothetical protein
LQVHDVPDSTWSNILFGKLEVKFKFLAVQILLSRLKLNLQKDASPTRIESYINEIKSLFAKYENLPPVQEDLRKIMEAIS